MSLNHAAERVAGQAPNYFAAAMMAKPEERGFLLAVLALDIELYTASKASEEEMVSTIRLAWWQDAVLNLSAKTHEHPILLAIEEAHVPKACAHEMVEAYLNMGDPMRLMLGHMAEHLGANGEELQSAVDEIANGEYSARRWSKAQRPIAAMLREHTRFSRLRLAITGWG